MRFIMEEFGSTVPVSVMGQYFPAYRAMELEAVSRQLTSKEYDQAREDVLAAGIERGWFQEYFQEIWQTGNPAGHNVDVDSK